MTSKRTGTRVPTSLLLDKPLLKALRSQNKLAPRQFDRLVEMHLLSQIPTHSRQAGTARLTQRGKASDAGDRAYYYWRLLVKQRVYKKNKDVLIQLERPDRVDKVEEAVADIGGDYERLLRTLEGRRVAESIEPRGNGYATLRGKRKVVEDDDDEDMEEEEGEEERGRKRRREVG
jgi:histone acetyltransferase 1